MSAIVRKSTAVCALLALVVIAAGSASANWSETFGGNAFDLPTWQFHCYPDLIKTFSGTVKDGPDNNDYLALDETTSATVGGSQFGMAIGAAEPFTDVRVGAVVNVTGGLRSYHGLGARTTYIIDDSSMTGYPGIIASSYVMLIHWQDGPANLRIEVFKIVNNLVTVMKTYHEEPVPGIGHARSYYAELDVVGSNPVYVTGSLYQYKGGPLMARTPTLIDTNGSDPWENAGVHDAVFSNGLSAVFSMNQNPQPPGYHASFDSVSSVSDGPAAVNPSPADGATGVPVNVALRWVEAAFATGRDVWLGKPGAMARIATPAGKTYTAGPLEFGQTYQWRIDQVGPSGPVTGRTWTFTTAECLAVEDFQTYADDAAIQAAWPHNIPGTLKYVLLAAGSAGNKTMRFECQNQYEPHFTEATRTFATSQDWMQLGAQALSLAFAGDRTNVEHPMYLKVEDAAGHSVKVVHPFTYACQSQAWLDWTVALADFSAGGVDLTHVKKLTIGLGSGLNSGQAAEDRDGIYVDEIRLCPARCFNPQQLDLRGDLNGDCKVDLADLAILADAWLGAGLSVSP